MYVNVILTCHQNGKGSRLWEMEVKSILGQLKKRYSRNENINEVKHLDSNIYIYLYIYIYIYIYYYLSINNYPTYLEGISYQFGTTYTHRLIVWFKAPSTARQEQPITQPETYLQNIPFGDVNPPQWNSLIVGFSSESTEVPTCIIYLWSF